MGRVNEYAIGDEVIVEVRFYSANEDGTRGVLTDPPASTASIRWKPEDGDPVSRHLNDAAVDKVSTGVYATPVVADAVGRWYYRGESTASLICASDPAYFTVSEDKTR